MANKGKAKCEKLKKIRKAVADKIGVDLHQKECTFEGNCTGTCPKCKQEEDILNRALLAKASSIAVAGIATLSLSACGPTNNDIEGGMTYEPPVRVEQTEGDVEIIDENTNETTEQTDENLGETESTWESVEPTEENIELTEGEAAPEDETDCYPLEGDLEVEIDENNAEDYTNAPVEGVMIAPRENEEPYEMNDGVSVE